MQIDAICNLGLLSPTDAIESHQKSKSKYKQQSGSGSSGRTVLAKLRLAMKMTFILLTAALLEVNASGVAQSITLSAKDIAFERIIREIESQTGYVVFANKRHIETAKPVTISVRNMPLVDFLEIVFKDQPLSYLIEDKTIILSVKPVIIRKYDDNLSELFDMPPPIKGRVTDASGNPLAGVNILVKGTKIGTASDDNGYFTINVPESAKILVFTSIGFLSSEIAISGSTQLNVTLQPNINELNDVVVVGYGVQRRQSVTSAISHLSGDAFREDPVSTVGDGIKGKIAGVRITSNNNSPGSNVTIRVRGGSSINNSNTPLILVDGVERTFEGINPNDIASIEVLKDAASSAIYGARASNGVVLITTKRGGYNRIPKATFEANIAHQSLESKIDFLDARDYIQILRPAVAVSPNPEWNSSSGYSTSANNSGNSIFSTRYYNPGDPLPPGWQTMVDPLDESKMLMFQDNDFQSLMYSSAYWQNYYISLDGGSERIRYTGSIGYTDDQGVAIATGYKRFNVRTNVDAKITDKLSITTGFDYSMSDMDQYDNQRDAISRGLANPPTQFVYREDGTPVGGYTASSLNPVFYDYISDRRNLDSYLSLIGGLKYQMLPDLSFDVNGSYYQNANKTNSFIRANEFSSAREAEAAYAEINRSKLDAYFTYKARWGDHSLGAIAGYSYQKRQSENLSAAAEGGSSDKIPTLNAAPIKTGASTTESVDVIIGYFGRLTYDFQEKYLFTATMRQDASSVFAEGNRWGFFPGVSAGWIVSNEKFLQHIQPLSFLKIRTSYGQTGNNAIGVYDAFGQFNASYRYDGNAGIRQAAMENRGLSWETTTQLDLGLEVGLFNDRIFLSADYFDKVTKDLLFDRPLPNTTGFSSIQTNIGKVKFYGWEMELTSRNIEKKHFGWKTRLVYSLTRNRVLQLPDNGIEKNRIGGIALGDGTFYGGIAEGEPLYRFFGYVAEGILQNEQEAANARYDDLARGFSPIDGTSIRGRKLPGDYEWKDRNGDGRITAADQFEYGVSVAPITGGINNDFRIGNFNISMYVDWAMGHSIYDESYSRYFLATFNTNYALVEDVKNTWKKEGDKTKYARFTANDSGTGSQNFTRRSSVFNYKGDYLCLRDLMVQYNVPAEYLKRFGLSGATFTLAGHTLFYLSEVKGISPEGGASSTYSASYYNYPPVRRISVGVRLTF